MGEKYVQIQWAYPVNHDPWMTVTATHTCIIFSCLIRLVLESAWSHAEPTRHVDLVQFSHLVVCKNSYVQ